MANTLEVEGLSVAFGRIEILRDLSFTVPEGSALAVIGPNGEGKTVLLRALIGSLPYPGTIRWAEGTRIGYVSQTLHVAFLADLPSATRVAALDPDRSPPDRFTVRGRELHLHYPNRLGRTRLTTQYFDPKPETTCTLRNWKALLEMVGAE